MKRVPVWTRTFTAKIVEALRLERHHRAVGFVCDRSLPYADG